MSLASKVNKAILEHEDITHLRKTIGGIMQKHIKTYYDYFDVAFYPGGEHEYIPCEVCLAPSVDVHHIEFRSQLGKDEIDNLIALCRDCHDKAHSGELPKFKLQTKHLIYLTQHKK